MDITVLEPADKNAYIEFLVDNFAEYSDPEVLRNAASNEIDCMFSDYFRKPVFYTYHENNELVATSGIIREWVAPNTYSIFWVCTREDKRGRGIGTNIIKKTIDTLAKDILKEEPGTVILYCLEHNCAFYEGLGFEKGPQGHKWIFMSKKINV